MSRKTSKGSVGRQRKKDRPVFSAKPKEKRTIASAPSSLPNAPSSPAKPQWAQFAPLLVFFCAAIAGTVIMLLATRQGIGITTDSTVYLSVARNLLEGHGFVQSAGTPLTHYPPLYPAVLALSGLLGGDLPAGAKWLQIILYVANTLLVGVLVYRGTNGSLVATTAGLLFVLTSQPFLYCHASVLSEALFLFFTLGGLLLITDYLNRHSVLTLIAASIIIGLASLTRYIGGTLIAVLVLSILLLDASSLGKRLIHSTIICIIFCFPIVIWLARNMIMYNSLVNRTITYHSISMEQINGAADTLSIWFLLPTNFPLVANVLLLLVIAFVAILFLITTIDRSGIHDPRNRVPLICIIFLCVYTCGLVLSIFFVEAKLPFNNRIMLPFHVVLGIGLISVCVNAFRLPSKWKRLAVLALLLCGALLAAHGQRIILLVEALSKNSMGFSSEMWKSSKAMEFVKALPDDALIYSNGPDAIDYLTGRQAVMIPRKSSSATEMQDMMQRVEKANGFLVYFHQITWRGYLPSAEELRQHAQLRAVYDGRDGTIYQVAELKK